MKYQYGVDQVALDKKDRRKIIITTVIFVVLILAIVVGMVVSVVNGNKPQASESTNTQVSQEINESEQLADQPTEVKPVAESVSSEEAPSATAQSATETEPTKPTANTATKTSADIPDTGPEDIIPLAIISGALTTYVASSYLVKKKTR